MREGMKCANNKRYSIWWSVMRIETFKFKNKKRTVEKHQGTGYTVPRSRENCWETLRKERSKKASLSNRFSCRSGCISTARRGRDDSLRIPKLRLAHHSTNLRRAKTRCSEQDGPSSENRIKTNVKSRLRRGGLRSGGLANRFHPSTF